jgi:hypothetical protein
MKIQHIIPLLLLAGGITVGAQTTNTTTHTKTMSYTLDICGDKKIQNPTEADIRQAISTLDTDKNSAFLILETSDMTYIQSSGDKKLGFDLEYQDGDKKHHFRAKRDSFTAEEIIKAMTSYSAGTDDWKKLTEWKQI